MTVKALHDGHAVFLSYKLMGNMCTPKGNDTSAQNDWKGAWWHSSFAVHSGFVEEDSLYASVGQKGTYYFELSRPLRTMDRLQQDAQFTLGGSSKVLTVMDNHGMVLDTFLSTVIGYPWISLPSILSYAPLPEVTLGMLPVPLPFCCHYLLYACLFLCYPSARVYLLHQWRTFRIPEFVWDCTKDFDCTSWLVPLVLPLPLHFLLDSKSCSLSPLWAFVDSKS